MIEIANMTRTAPAISRGGLDEAFNRVRPAYSRETVGKINLGKQIDAPRSGAPRPAQPTQPAQPAPPSRLNMPELLRPALKGQKVSLGILQGKAARLTVGFGWNVKDARCDVDASAFLLTGAGRVPSDDWFVFYGHTESPDRAVSLRTDGRVDRQTIGVELGRLDPTIERIVFVMTINEALEKGLNFGMIAEAWLRVLDGDGRELVSYRPTELYENITSMTLGELYLRKDEWRFNPVGNGVSMDLAGQCAVYGVDISE